MDLIKKWLAGKRNFIIGSVLYKQFGTDEKLKKLFEGRPDAYAQRRLEEELSALLIRPAAPQKVDTTATGEDEMPESTDPVLKSIRQEWLPIYQRMNYLRHELDRYPGNSEQEIAIRQPMAFEILDLEQQCMVIWMKRGYYQTNGNLPDVKVIEDTFPDDPFELTKLIDATKRNIRRNKQLTEKHPDNPAYPLKAKQYQEQLEKIMQKVNNGKTER